MGRKPKRDLKRRTELEHLQSENEYLRAENAILKKVKRTPIEGGKRERRKTEIVQELMTEFSLDILLKAIKLARSTYYYHLKQLTNQIRTKSLKLKFNPFYRTQGNYAYRRIY